VQTEPDTRDIYALVQNFKESQKGGEEEEEQKEEEEKCRGKTYVDAVKISKEL
jgi:hypothetical protein